MALCFQCTQNGFIPNNLNNNLLTKPKMCSLITFLSRARLHASDPTEIASYRRAKPRASHLTIAYCILPSHAFSRLSLLVVLIGHHIWASVFMATLYITSLSLGQLTGAKSDANIFLSMGTKWTAIGNILPTRGPFIPKVVNVCCNILYVRKTTRD